MNSREFRERLQRRARRAGAVISPSLVASLESYFRLLSAWNRKINLTGLRLDDPADEVFDRLLIEPVLASRHLPTNMARTIDIGSGGGSPAIPMKLVMPTGILTMVESKTRKSVFLREAIRELGLTGAEVVTARFEELLSRPDLHETQDGLTIRAVRIEPRVLMGLQAFIRPGGAMYLFRGSSGGNSAETVTPPLFWRATYPLVESLRSRLVVLGKRDVGTKATYS